MDAPVVVADGGIEQTWRPENDGGQFSGPTRLREALVHSRNLVSIRLLRAIGTDDVIEYASRFGFDPAVMPKNLTLALGTLPATPLEVATGYAAFANGGYKISALLHRAHRERRGADRVAGRAEGSLRRLRPGR